MRRHLDAAELAAAAEGACHSVPVATRSETAAVAGTSYAAAVTADADVATAAEDAATVVPACAGAGCASDGASAIRRGADCRGHQGRFLDDRQRPPGACNWRKRWGWTDVHWELMSVPYGCPYRC